MEIEIQNVKAEINGTPILKGVNLTMRSGEIHALMGPNGSGKSTLSNVIFGNETYTVTEGTVLVDGKNILEMETHERARLGLFLAFQYPVGIPGVSVGRFLKRATSIRFGDNNEKNRSFVKRLRMCMTDMGIDQQFINRYLNDGFSGGEKKRMEILQMLMLEPEFAILDETDSGLDIDALKIVAQGVNLLHKNTSIGALIITHYQRVLEYIKPNFVHVMYKGAIVKSGGAELVNQLEAEGYDWIKKDHIAEEEEA